MFSHCKNLSCNNRIYVKIFLYCLSEKLFVNISNYINLRTCTTASLDYGIFNIKEAIEKIKEKPEEYSNIITITENNNMYSFVSVMKQIQKSGMEDKIKTIVGVDITIGKKRNDDSNQVDKYNVLMLAKNNNGYTNLCKLQTVFYKSRKKEFVLEEQVGEYLDDIFVLSGGNTGFLFNTYVREIINSDNKDKINEAKDKINTFLNFWQEQTKGNFFVELQRDGTQYENEYINFIMPIALKMGIPVVATNNTYFTNKEDYETHEFFMVNKSQNNYKAYLGLKRKPVPATPENYLKSNSEMTELFSDIPVALQATNWIAENCNANINLKAKPFLPELKSPNPDEDINEYFARWSREGLDEIMLYFYDKYVDDLDNLPQNNYFKKFQEWKNLNIDKDFVSKQELLNILKETQLYKEYRERLEYEIGIILEMKFPSYFVVVADFIKWAKENNVSVGPGRGSGAGSLVAYALKITALDPLQFDLLFERFLNPERVSMPDFDIDFSSKTRDNVIEYVKQKYNVNGKIAVAQIMNVGRYEHRAAIDMAAKSLNMNPLSGMVKSIKALIDEKEDDNSEYIIDADEEENDEEKFEGGFFAKLKDKPEFLYRYDNSTTFKKIVDIASKYYGNMRNVMKHAAGIVISSKPLEEILPITNINGSDITQLNKDDSESLGVVKFDFLGLTNLHVMELAIEEINKKRRKEGLSDFTLDDLYKANIYDENVYEHIFKKANSENVFQFSSENMRKYMLEMKPNSFEDLIALVSLYRPGPMDLIPDYIRRMHGEPFEYMHPLLEPILKSTYGIMVYQEQVMQAAQVIGGYTLGAADLLRRAMGKKKPEEMIKHRDIFAEGAAKKGISREKADEIFNYMESFAGYGFNKSHAAAYALISFQTAWLKHYYPKEYMMAVLNSSISKDKYIIEQIIDDAKHNGVVINGLSINESKENFHLNDKGEIVIPFSLIKGADSKIKQQIAFVRDKQRIKFSDCIDFVNTMFQQNKQITEKDFITLLKAGAFDEIETQENIKKYLINAKAVINNIRNKQTSISDPILKRLPMSMIKSNAKITSKMIEFVEISGELSLKDKMKNQHSLLGMNLNKNELQELVLLQKKLLSSVKDNNKSLYSILSNISDAKTKIIQEYSDLVKQNQKVNKYDLNKYGKILVSGYVAEEIKTKYNDKVFKIVTEDGVYKIKSKSSAINKLKIELFENYIFDINVLALPSETSNQVDFHYTINEVYDTTNIVKQVVHDYENAFVLNLDDNQLKDFEVLVDKAKSLKTEPIKIHVNGNDKEVLFDEDLVVFLEKNQLELNIQFNERLIKENKLLKNGISGRANQTPTVDEFNEMIENNDTLRTFYEYAKLSNGNYQKEAVSKIGNHMIMGYIKRYNKGSANKRSSFIFVDEIGNEMVFAQSPNMEMPTIKLNQPCVIKFSFNKNKNGNGFSEAYDLYYEQDLEHILEKSFDIIKRQDIIDNKEEINKLKEQVDVEYLPVRTLSETGILEKQQYRLPVSFVKEHSTGKIFNFDNKYITNNSFENNFCVNNKNYLAAEKVFEELNDFHQLNYLYIEKGNIDKFTNKFTTIFDINEYGEELSRKEQTVMSWGIVTDISQFNNLTFVTIADTTDSVSIKVDKEEHIQLFKESLEQEKMMCFKFKTNLSEKNGIVYKSILDIYSKEQIVQNLAQEIVIKIESNQFNDLKQIVEDNQLKDNKKIKPITIKVKTDDDDKFETLVCQYTDKLYQDLQEKLNLKEKFIFIKINNSIRYVDGKMFGNNVQFNSSSKNKPQYNY